MNKKYNLDYGLTWLSIIAVSAGVLIAWGLYVLPIDYPFRPLFLFVTAPAILLVFVNIHAVPKDNPNAFWACVNNMLILLAGANIPMFVDDFFEITMKGDNYLSDALIKIINYGIIAVGTCWIAVGTCWAVAINIRLIRRHKMPEEKQNMQ
ncbi:hypothetical protein FP371_23220 [Citrobacter freundii]|uniref:hypothetical protein n=1 Tax=Gammaproteobacteria TaxID=1236 RepID=UPI0005CFD3E3|nr:MULTISPECIES: hypothetical protein [Gammaproteobacteria]EEA2350394.1 hypothetical protein [Salmonella enterica subsp. enterica serovar Enteritidis]EEC4304172.1 hypothetical protein [Salmonella enterica subsp. enterica serovar Enteritidis]EEN2406596.1 hypothetical protein [Salmonella enterica subsp. enterica serovar Enteritidis]EHX2410631.1 hypothetical protein [Salmonella enterica subsp. enterica serovar Enteritidis]MBD5651588.1 hypothetical protein [Citrobacter freundii]